MQPGYSRQSQLKLVSTIIAIVGIAGVILFIDHMKSSKSMTVATTTGTQSSTTTPSVGSTDTSSSAGTSSATSASSGSSYKDGTYTATSDYYVPHGSEEIGVTLTVKDGVITDSSITNSEGDHDSVRYQEDFASEYKSYVVGQKLSGFKLAVISGASDTTEGFNDAINQIETKAQA